MVKVIMHGCNGYMGQVVSGLIKDDPEIEIVAGIDLVDCRDNGYPVFTDIDACQVEADAVIDFCSAKAVDKLLDYCVRRKIPVVLCTTGLSQEQLEKVEEASRQVAVLKSANMSVGINLLMKVLKEVAPQLAAAGFDIEVVEKHHRRKVDAPWQTASTRPLRKNTTIPSTAAAAERPGRIRKSASPLCGAAPSSEITM